MLLAWLLSPSMAAPPDTLRQLLEIDTSSGGQVERMKVSLFGDILVGRTQGDLQGWVYDLDAWQFVRFDVCDVTGVAPVDYEFEDGTPALEVWASCANGTVRALSWDGTAVTPVRDEDGSEVSIRVNDSLSDIWFDGDGSGYLYALSVAGDGNATVHIIDPLDAEFDAVDAAVAATWPQILTNQGYLEGVIINPVLGQPGQLVVSHGGVNGFSTLTLGLAPTLAAPVLTNLLECNDLAPTAQNTVYCVDRTRDLVGEFRPLTLNAPTVLPLGELSGPEAVGASLDPNDGWLAVTGNQVQVWGADASGVIDGSPTFTGPDNAANPINDIVSYDGYLFGGGPQGRLHVVSARPWVYPNSVALAFDGAPLTTEDTVSNDDEVNLTFFTDTDVDYEVLIGGTRVGDGRTVADGSATADVETSVTLTIDDAYAEGTNRLYIVATDRDGLTGHARTEIVVDNAPLPPDLSDDDVAFGDGELRFSFEGITDEDLASYAIYVMATPWDGADFPTGGPTFDGNTDLETPIIVDAAGGDDPSVRIRPLENEVTYYIGVRATDTGGKEGPMSAVVSGMPRTTFTAAERANEEGGSPCSTGGGTSLAWWAVLGLGGVAMMRRRLATVAAVGVVAGLVAASSTAWAQSSRERTPPWLRRDLTPVWGNVEIRYGIINLDDDNITDVYKDRPTNLLQAEVGPQFFRVAELDFGFGFFQELAYTIDAAGDQSGDRTMLTWFPFSVSITARGHILDEQPIVPTFRYGWDYVLWSEKSDNNLGTKDVIDGAKVGNHYALGLQLLLDIIQPRRASLLEAQSGINDSWLTFEYRRQRIDGRGFPTGQAVDEGLQFDGDAFMVGLKLDY